MNATITGSAASGAYTGSRTQLDYEAHNAPSTPYLDLRDGASSAISMTLSNLGDKLVAARWKLGSSVTGSITVVGGSAGQKIVMNADSASKQVLATVDANGDASASFSFSGQGDELSVEHA